MADRTTLFIDKLSVTFQPNSLRQCISIQHALEGMAARDEISRVTGASPQLTAYEHAFVSRKQEGKSTFTIQASPRRSSSVSQIFIPKRFLRFEWNPAKSESMPQEFFQVCQLILDDGFLGNEKALIESLNITRADFTFDVPGQHIGGLYIYRQPLRRTSSRLFTYHYAETGVLQTISIGKPESDVSLMVYDKRAEMLARATPQERRAILQQERAGRIRRRQRPITRFELTLNDAGSVVRLLNRKNPFEPVRVGFVPKIRVGLSLSPEERYFLDSVHLRGAQAALSFEPSKRKRKRLEELLSKFECPDWFNPEAIWSERHQALGMALSQLTGRTL